MIIAIDGPAGSGKSTVSKLIAKKLGILYVDTGAMYRALTLKAMRRRVNLKDEEALVELANKTKVDLKHSKVNGTLKVLLDGEDVSKAIRTQEVTNNVWHIAKTEGVRKKMAKLQRDIATSSKGAILEGRDIGTVVLPDADYKFYLDARFDERAHRRYKELVSTGEAVKKKNIKEDLERRDSKDLTRKVAPLKKADDAIYVDTTDLGIPQVVDKLLGYIK